MYIYRMHRYYVNKSYEYHIYKNKFALFSLHLLIFNLAYAKICSFTLRSQYLCFRSSLFLRQDHVLTNSPDHKVYVLQQWQPIATQRKLDELCVHAPPEIVAISYTCRLLLLPLQPLPMIFTFVQRSVGFLGATIVAVGSW